MELFHRIAKAVRNLPDDIDDGMLDLPNQRVILSCHILVRAVAKVYNLRYQDGFSPTTGFEHSWLLTLTENIIDVYPVGVMGGPIMIDSRVGRLTYLPKSTVSISCGRFSQYWFRRAVKKVVVFLRDIDKSA